jgi:hypothetical protein
MSRGYSRAAAQKVGISFEVAGPAHDFAENFVAIGCLETVDAFPSKCHRGSGTLHTESADDERRVARRAR